MSSLNILKKSGEFSYVIRNGLIFCRNSLVVHILKSEHPLRFGICVGKKIGNAVERNKTKRRFREILRGILPHIEFSGTVVIIARAGCKFLSFNDLRENCFSLFRKAGLIV